MKLWISQLFSIIIIHFVKKFQNYGERSFISIQAILFGKIIIQIFFIISIIDFITAPTFSVVTKLVFSWAFFVTYISVKPKKVPKEKRENISKRKIIKKGIIFLQADCLYKLNQRHC